MHIQFFVTKLILALALAGSAVAVAGRVGDSSQVDELFSKVSQEKASAVKGYGQYSYAHRRFFSARDRVVKVNLDNLKMGHGEMPRNGTRFKIDLFDGESLTLETEAFMLATNSTWAWTVRQVLPEELKGRFGSVSEANEYGLTIPELEQLLTTSTFFVQSWDVHEPTGEVSYSGDRLAQNVSPNPEAKPERKAGQYTAKAFYSVEGRFLDLKTGKPCLLSRFPLTPKYALLMEIDPSPDKQFSIDGDSGRPAALSNEGKEKLDRYNAYINSTIQEEPSVKVMREEP
ncbi:hypothetical protein [Kineobactrum sediminis]|nr:hypothetical protein [Kineobactrum sediminis]